MEDFTKSRLWQHAHILSLRIHLEAEPTQSCSPTGLSPPSDLCVELHCAAVAIPATIAQALRTPAGPSAARLWCLAQTSTVETEELLFLCRDAGLISVEAAAPLLEELDVLVRVLVPLATPDGRMRSPAPPPPRPMMAPKAVSARVVRRTGGSRVP